MRRIVILSTMVAAATIFSVFAAPAPGVHIGLELPPGPDNPRNSEGAFMPLKDGRIMSATGLSPHSFQLKCCVDRAKELLARGESVESVAARLGFASRQHFSATFKRFAGMSPRTWRERHMKTQM